MTDSSRESVGRGWRVAAVVLACLVALALPFVIIMGMLDRGGLPARPVAAAAAPTTSSAPKATSTATATSTPSTSRTQTSATDDSTSAFARATESCRLSALRVTAALGAGDVSLAQFDKHIDAMNFLVAGKISLAVARQFWDETRVGASQNVTAFQRAKSGLTQSGIGCGALPAGTVKDLPSGEVQQLDRCVAYVSAGDAALGKADVAVKTWAHHIHDMEMLRAGHLTPAQATAAWQKSWRTGELLLQSFVAARKQATSAGCTLQ